MLATLSLWKRPTKVTNWKSVPSFFLFAQACEKIFIKMHRIKSRYVIGPWNILFAGVYVCIFQLRNVTGWDSEGVKYFVSKFWFRFSWYTAPLVFLNDHHSQSSHPLPDQVLAVHVQAYLVCTRLITFSDLLRNTCTAFGSTCLTPLLPSNKLCHWK